MQSKTTLQLQQQFMNEHAEEFRHFTRLLLTTSAGTLALTAGLSGQRQAGPNWSETAEAMFQMGWALLAVSLLCGLALQWLITTASLNDANTMKSIEERAAAQEDQTGYPLLFRRLPQRRQKWYFHAQVGTFLGAVLALTAAIVWR